MNDNKTSKLVYSALLGTLVFIGTQFIRVPLPFGYFNMGDCFVLLSGWMIGGVYAMIGSAIGAGLADLLAGYAVYAPATIVIKACMSVVAYGIFNVLKKVTKCASIIGWIVSGIAAEALMVAGYFAYDCVLYGMPGALLSVTGNVLQGIIALVGGAAFMKVLEHTKLLERVKEQIK